jgi:hypothetical protein
LISALWVGPSDDLQTVFPTGLRLIPANGDRVGCAINQMLSLVSRSVLCVELLDGVGSDQGGCRHLIEGTHFHCFLQTSLSESGQLCDIIARWVELVDAHFCCRLYASRGESQAGRSLRVDDSGGSHTRLGDSELAYWEQVSAMCCISMSTRR